jgi:hypothetical protein
VVAMVRLMLKAKNLPGTFWGEAIYTAVYIHNRTFCKGVNSKTSFKSFLPERRVARRGLHPAAARL